MTDTRATEAPREDLIRMTTTLRAEDEGNTLVGYAAVFNKWTEIDSWEGRFKERIAPGAFRKTLNERGSRVKVLFNHGMDPSIGDKPLGKPTVMEENARGLKVEVPLDDTSYNADIKALLRSGALDGMSFRMTVVGEEWDYPDAELPERTIKEIRLYEFGPVTFPAYEATQAGVRAHAPSAFEAWRSAKIIREAKDPAVDLDGSTEHLDRAAAELAAALQDTNQSAGDATDDSGPDAQATRGTEDTYQPAQRVPMSPERRQAQMGTVRALLAQTLKET